MQLGHIYSLLLSFHAPVPYSTAAPSVVATRAFSEEGSSEISVSPTHQAPATGGKCVCVHARMQAVHYCYF